MALDASMKRYSSGARAFFLGLEFPSSAWMLIAANLFAIGVAYATGMGLGEMLFVYWMQSVIIGICAVIRILNLKTFSTGSVIPKSPEETSREKKQAALFFAGHYGFMHAMYLGILCFGGPSTGKIHGSLLGFGLCPAAFALNHGYSLHKNMRADAEGKPNLTDLQLLPYLRIVPMHLTVVVGNAMANSIAAMILFLLFKTFTDVVLHCIEHRALRSTQPGQV